MKPASGQSQTYVALLRGINVGGKHILPMRQLVEVVGQVKCTNVRSYIQSGNVVFSAPPAVAAKVPLLAGKEIEKRFGFSAPVILRDAEQLAGVVHRNPYLKAGAPDGFLHVYFLADLPRPEAVATLDPARSFPDVFSVVGQEIYLSLPNGMGRSKLTSAYFDSRLSTVCTARNWATVLKLHQMMQD
jgi:uncharacterized protein (DUF1697 family)